MKPKSSIKQNKFKIDLDPYGALLTVILTDNVPEATKKYNQAKEIDNSDLAVFIYEVPDNRKYCIILDYKATPGEIAHEVNHLTTMMLTSCGVDIITNDEPNCYYIGHIVDKIWDKLQKVNKKKELEEKDGNKSPKE